MTGKWNVRRGILRKWCVGPLYYLLHDRIKKQVYVCSDVSLFSLLCKREYDKINFIKLCSGKERGLCQIHHLCVILVEKTD